VNKILDNESGIITNIVMKLEWIDEIEYIGGFFLIQRDTLPLTKISI